jgi:hypothetical protein
MLDQNKVKQMDDTQDKYISQQQDNRSVRPAARQGESSNWLTGVALITIGLLYLLHHAGILHSFTNWWALFILMPAAGSFSTAMRAYQHAGGVWTKEAFGSFLAGMLFLGLTAVFLFSLNLSLFGPLLLIGTGLLLLFGPR